MERVKFEKKNTFVLLLVCRDCQYYDFTILYKCGNVFLKTKNVSHWKWFINAYTFDIATNKFGTEVDVKCYPFCANLIVEILASA